MFCQAQYGVVGELLKDPSQMLQYVHDHPAQMHPNLLNPTKSNIKSQVCEAYKNYASMKPVA